MTGCLKVGGWGCAGLGAALIGLLFMAKTLDSIRSPNSEPLEDVSIEHSIPRPGAQLRSEVEAQTVQLEKAEQPLLDQPAGELRLELEIGEFEVRPGPPGESIRVDAEYDSSNYELIEEFSADDLGNWSYRVDFGKRKGLQLSFWGANVTDQNRVTIIVPKDVLLSIDAQIAVGRSSLELGGLWMDDLELDFGVGDHSISFQDQTAAPIESLEIKSGVGRLDIRSLGRASPDHVDIEQGIGRLDLDLAGVWLRDSTISLETGIGGCRVELGPEARIELDKASTGIGKDQVDRKAIDRHNSDRAADAPLLTLEIEGGLGNIQIDFPNNDTTE